MKPDFDSLIEKECKTCTKICLVFPEHEGEVECENCYITKLELFEKRKRDLREQKQAKIFGIRNRKVISG